MRGRNQSRNNSGSVRPPVEAARVICRDQSVYSNAEGRFTINGPDKCQTHIEKTGFEPATADLSGAAEAKITLDLAGRVDSVVVSANRTETTPEQAAVAANVISEQQLSARQFPMIFDVLREIPGLQVSAYGPPELCVESLLAAPIHRHVDPAGWRPAERSRRFHPS